MADYIEVDMAILGKDIGELRKTLELVKRDMNSMFESVEELDKMWEGESNAAFNRQFHMDCRMMEALCKVVNSMIDNMENARDSYLKCETDVRSEIEKIRI